jgi:hypothetical protein
MILCVREVRIWGLNNCCTVLRTVLLALVFIIYIYMFVSVKFHFGRTDLDVTGINKLPV